MADSIDPREYRNALGHYATGVTVVTTMCKDGPLGMTANSFASVSMDPPLVLWSPARKSERFHAFANADYFTIHILASHQQDISNLFARNGLEPFNGLEFTKGLGDAPIIPDCAATFQCEKHAGYDGGDHLILVGEVLKLDHTDHPPLVYHRGGYQALADN